MACHSDKFWLCAHTILSLLSSEFRIIAWKNWASFHFLFHISRCLQQSYSHFLSKYIIGHADSLSACLDAHFEQRIHDQFEASNCSFCILHIRDVEKEGLIHVFNTVPNMHLLSSKLNLCLIWLCEAKQD